MRHFKGISVGLAWGLADDRADGDEGLQGLRRSRTDGPATGLLTFESGDLVRGDLPQCVHCTKDDDCCYLCAAQGCEGGADCLCCDDGSRAVFEEEELGPDSLLRTEQLRGSMPRPQY